MKTFNKKGDTGRTSLLFGHRVPKSGPRCEAYGTIDEAVSLLGLARSQASNPEVREAILKVQKELFTVGAEIATRPDECERLATRFGQVTMTMADELENLITGIEAKIEMPKSFIIPGANPASAALDVARAVVRRAERRVVALTEAGALKNEALLPYLNRLADLLFVLARYEEGKPESKA